MASQAQPVDMQQFQSILSQLSPDISVCVRGKHAIGKSEGVYQGASKLRNDVYKDPAVCARLVESFGGAIKTPSGPVTHWEYDFGVPVVERRLSQMTEGDIIGLPFREGEDTFNETGARLTFASTQFKPCDWIIISAEFPVMLFLDERNRALPGVNQAVFQLTDSKAFYGTRLHPETRIVIAENIGDEYQIESCDPAEVSRCATVHLVPTVKDFLDYISDKSNLLMVQFLREHEKLIEHQGANYEPNKKYPDRRSWFKLDSELTKLGIYEDPKNSMFHVIVGSFVGVEATAPFVQYVREYKRNVTAEKILKDWVGAKKVLSLGGEISAESFMECAGKLQDHFSKKKLTDDQVYELARFMFDSPAEVQMSLWTGLQSKMDNLMRVHVYVKNLMVTTTGSSQSNEKPVLPPKVKKAKALAKETAATDEKVEATPAAKKRGGKAK